VDDVTHFSPASYLQGVGLDYANVSDAELITAGNADAFAVIYDRHADRLFRWARARTGDYAADLTAEVFARAWLKRSSFRDQADGSAFPWLVGIAGNVLRDSLRKRRIEDRARAKLGLPRTLASDPGYERVEQRLSLPEAARTAIADLPAAEREILDLRIVEERPYAEIAARLRCSPQAARLRVSRALRRLNLALGGQPK
jgi:RNA polymerase sigma-70 factor (ECF subfamily)